MFTQRAGARAVEVRAPGRAEVARQAGLRGGVAVREFNSLNK